MNSEQNQTSKLILLIFILLIGSIILVSVDFSLVHKINQNPENFYVSEIVGISMYPRVYTGDIFVIQKSNSPEFSIDVGDIIVYYADDSYIGHRVISMNGDYVITRGDYNDASEKVYNNQIVGNVIKTISRYNVIGQKVTSWISEN